MARTAKKKEPAKEAAAVVTRAEKKDATKNIIRELLAVKPLKHNELIEEVAKLYTERFGGADTENVNDVKGRVGSVLDIMKKESDVAYDGGMYALKSRTPAPAPEEATETPVKKTRKTAKKAEKEPVKAEEAKAETVEEKPAKKTRGRKPKAEKTEEKAQPLPAAPIQPIAPVTPVTPEAAPEPIPEEKTEAPAPKKRGRKPKAKTEAPAPAEKPAEIEEKAVEAPATPAETPTVMPVETPVPIAGEVKEEPAKEEPKQLIVKEKAEVAKKNVVMDMSFLFGDVKPKAPVREEKKAPVKAEEKREEISVKAEEPAPEKTVAKVETPVKAEEKPAVKLVEKPAARPVKTEKQPAMSAMNVKSTARVSVRTIKKAPSKPLTAEEKLREAFLKRLRSLSGDYFEYYSVYLLERYSMKNGRRLEGLRISGGDHDGGIDGEIELTDRLGFRETIYIQSKNWNPEKGDEKLWVVGETLLQQFIGACACRQAKDGKQNCRGIFITTSRFTPEAKRILDDLSDKVVGYDGNDLFEAAKECGFGLVQKNGEWVLDERLLSGSKAFFNLY